jgi:2,4-dienoyl-CoA reductase (NADPH2)
MAGRTTFEKLLEPGQIGNVKTKNRMFKTAAGSTCGDATGTVTERHKAFYGALAKGGVGLIVVESCSIEPPLNVKSPSAPGGFLRLDEDKFMPSLKELTELIHKYNCPTFVQMMLGGATQYVPGIQPASSSPLTPAEMKDRYPYHKGYLLDNPPPRELTIQEIEDFVDAFAKAAERARKAGFDGVEINACNGHLLNAFVSRVWNRRQDKYGCQNLENRARFVVEIIREIKKRLGQDFTVTVIINAAEYGLDECTTVEEGQGIAQILQNAGADAIQTRVMGYRDIGIDLIWPERIFIPEPPKPLPKEMDWHHKGAGSHVPIAAAIKKVVSVPVLVAGRLDPELGEIVLRQGKADFIGFTRRLQADPELPNKIASGRLDDVAPCTACSHCLEANSLRIPIVCRVNAALGGEQEYTIRQVSQAEKRKIVVVGGGPAAMEAARVAATSGHEVLLYEKERKLGGLLPLATLVKGTEIEDLPALVRYLENQIRKLGVQINLGKEFNPSLVEEIKPDVVILATGGKPAVPGIPGIKRRNVVTNADLHRRAKIPLKLFGPNVLRWLTRFWMPLGRRVVIIGGAIQGCELAEFLVKRGRKVSIVDTAETLGELMPIRNKMRLFKWLAEKGVIMMCGVKYEEITDKGLIIITKEGKRQTIEADTIVTAIALKPSTELLKALEGKVPQIYCIGDCIEPRLIIHAIADGYRVASAIPS